jgi:Cytosine specific DNA methyltransferase replication foci domain
MLCDWAVFDARPSKAKDGGGALALALISLNALDEVALNITDAGCAPEGAGDASPYCENEEDAGQEDDGDYDNDDGASDEEGVSVSVRLRLGAILRYTIDYTKRDEYVPQFLLRFSPFWRHERRVLTQWYRDALRSPIYLETTAAWYILGSPTQEYRAFFVPFFRAHKIAQVLVCALMHDQRTSIDDFIAELQLSGCTLMGNVSGSALDMYDVQDAVRLPFLDYILRTSNE